MRGETRGVGIGADENGVGDAASVAISVVIPTYRRGRILLQTLRHCGLLQPQPREVLVVDQTEQHPAEVETELERLDARGVIRRLRSSPPSIPAAMNRGLCEAEGEVVLFVDDDIEPEPELLRWHAEAHRRTGATVVAGQVLQPGISPQHLCGSEFAFHSSLSQEVSEVAGGNFSVDREFALAVGGFDQNFVRAAYRFEREYCDRARAAGARIVFEPRASLRHLRAMDGGTRARGSHLRSWSPGHSVGEYYYLLGAAGRRGRGRELISRPWRAIATRHHARNPWWIPATLCAELSGFVWAAWLRARGPRLLAAGARERCDR